MGIVWVGEIETDDPLHAVAFEGNVYPDVGVLDGKIALCGIRINEAGGLGDEIFWGDDSVNGQPGTIDRGFCCEHCLELALPNWGRDKRREQIRHERNARWKS